jgi:hypothetical protein
MRRPSMVGVVVVIIRNLLRFEEYGVPKESCHLGLPVQKP